MPDYQKQFELTMERLARIKEFVENARRGDDNGS